MITTSSPSTSAPADAAARTERHARGTPRRAAALEGPTVDWTPVPPLGDPDEAAILALLRPCIGAGAWEKLQRKGPVLPRAQRIGTTAPPRGEVSRQWRTWRETEHASDLEYARCSPDYSLVPERLAQQWLTSHGDAALAWLIATPRLRLGARNGEETILWAWEEVLRRRPAGVIWTRLCDDAAATWGWVPPALRWSPTPNDGALLDPTRLHGLPTPKPGNDLRREVVMRWLRLEQLPTATRRAMLTEAQYEGFQVALIDASPDADPTEAPQWPAERWRQITALARQAPWKFGPLLSAAVTHWLRHQHAQEQTGNLRSGDRKLTEELVGAAIAYAPPETRAPLLEVVTSVMRGPLPVPPPESPGGFGDVRSLSNRLDRLLLDAVWALTDDQRAQLLAACPPPPRLAQVLATLPGKAARPMRAQIHQEHERERAGLRHFALTLVLGLAAWLRGGPLTPDLAARLDTMAQLMSPPEGAPANHRAHASGFGHQSVLVLQRLYRPAAPAVAPDDLAWPTETPGVWMPLFQAPRVALEMLQIAPRSLPQPQRRALVARVLGDADTRDLLRGFDHDRIPDPVTDWGLTAEDRLLLRPLLTDGDADPALRHLGVRWLGRLQEAGPPAEAYEADAPAAARGTGRT